MVLVVFSCAYTESNLPPEDQPWPLSNLVLS